MKHFDKGMEEDNKELDIRHLCLEIGKFEESELFPYSRKKLLSLSRELSAALSM